jgi:predicted transcriptional regulator
MNTLIIGNQTEQQARDAFLRAWNSGQAEAAARVDFVSLDDAWRVLSRNRRHILRAMAGAGPLAVREIARRVERDLRAVHSDLQHLSQAGVIDKDEAGRLILPYDTITFDVTLDARAAA